MRTLQTLRDVAGVTDITDVAGVTDVMDVADVTDITDVAGVMDVTDITGGTVRDMASCYNDYISTFIDSMQSSHMISLK